MYVEADLANPVQAFGGDQVAGHVVVEHGQAVRPETAGFEHQQGLKIVGDQMHPGAWRLLQMLGKNEGTARRPIDADGPAGNAAQAWVAGL